MILNFEVALSQWLSQLLPTSKKVIWGTDESVFDFSSSFKQFPFIVFRREEDDSIMPRSFDNFYSHPVDYSFAKHYEMPSEYLVRIYQEKRTESVNHLVQARSFIEENPYVYFTHMGDLIKLGMRLLYITLKDERDANDIKGTIRYVELKLLFNLIISKEMLEGSYGLIEGITIGINDYRNTFVKLENIGWTKI